MVALDSPARPAAATGLSRCPGERCGADEFRDLMSHWPTGVTVVTSWDGDKPVGCTVNAMMSVSLDPPLLVVALATGSRTLEAIRRTGTLGLNVLSADQRDLCQRFACGSQHERFRHLHFGDEQEVPLLRGTAAAAVCTVRETPDCGDHVLIVAEPVWHTEREDGSPLVFHRSSYRRLGDGAARVGTPVSGQAGPAATAAAASAVQARLTAVPLDDLILHESVDQDRLRGVARALNRAGVLKNPVLATPLPEGKWLVIDGAHRVSALRRLGIDMALAQIFDHGEYEVTAWHHLVSTRQMPDQIEHLLADRCPACVPERSAGVCVAVAEVAGRAAHVWSPSPDLADAVARLRELSTGCAVAGRVRRISPDDRVPDRHAGQCLRIAYRPWPFDRLREMAARGLVLPAGVTRFIAPGRVLGANIPLSMLSRDHRAAMTAGTIGQHLKNLSLRYYAEPVFIGE